MKDSASSNPGPSVRTGSGVVSGVIVDGVTAFLGVPYAAAPVGQLWMRAPQPVPAWNGVRPAARFGATAPKGDYPPQFQRLFPEVVFPGTEYLNLNVWTPDAGAHGLPVLVWIHGGSFTNGSGSVAEYDGHAFARDGVVCVTINYRLGAEGFLYFDDGHANLGLLDQIAALEWVRDNIAAFGGDPQRVTLAGESAGAMSVTTLLAVPAARGLFRRAITQSGSSALTQTPQQGLLVSHYLAAALGVEPTRDAIRACPRDRIVQTASGLVTEIQSNPDYDFWGDIALGGLPFAPVVDGAVLPCHPLEAITRGQSGDVSLLTGWNRDEARLFFVAADTIDVIDDDLATATAAIYGLSEDRLAVYRANRPGATAGDVQSAVVTDWYYAIPAIRTAEARWTSSTMATPAGRPQTWLYRFDYPEPDANNGLGACHGAELPYVFDTIHISEVHPRIGDAPSRAVADTVHRAWVSYITGGDPGWSAYTLRDRITGLLGPTITEVSDPGADERALWEGTR